MKFDVTEINAVVFLQKITDFVSRHNRPDWSYEQQKNHEPSYVRLQQLDSLLQLFVPEVYREGDFSWSFDAVMEGRFIEKRDLAVYRNLFAEMDSVIEKHPMKLQKEAWEAHTLEHNFRDIIRLKSSLNDVLSHNSGVAEISYPYMYSVALSDELIGQMNLKKIDDFLWTVIDPEKRVFSKTELVKSYGYPDDDLDEIDLFYW